MPSTPGVCGKFYGFRAPGTLQMTQSGASRAACQSLKRSSRSGRSAPEKDHHRVIAAALRPPPDWRRPPGRPRSTWLRVIDEGVRPQNFGVHTAWRKAKDRDTWHQVVSTATLCYEFATKKRSLTL